MLHHMKLVKENPSLGHILTRRLLKGLPHVHKGQPYLLSILRPNSLVKSIQTLFGSVILTLPGGTSPFQVAQDNPIPRSCPQRYLVYPFPLCLLSPLLQAFLLHLRVYCIRRSLPFQTLNNLPYWLPVKLRFRGV